MPLTNQQLEKRIRNIERRIQKTRQRSGEHAGRRVARLQGRLDRQRQLLSLPEDQRPAPLKVTGEVLQGALRAVGAVVPPPTGPVLKLAAAVLDRAPDVRTATRGGDATDVIGVLEDTLVDAMKRSGLDERTAKAKLADLLEHLEDAFDD